MNKFLGKFFGRKKGGENPKEGSRSQPATISGQIVIKKIRDPGDIKYDYSFKVVLVGDSGVGITSFMHRFVDDTFIDEQNNDETKVIAIQMYAKKVVKLQIIDGGCLNKGFRNQGGNPYKCARTVIICFDTTDQESFDNVKQWLSEVDRYTCDSADVIIVGLKSDLPPVVDHAVAKDFSDSIEKPLMYCSSKTGEGVGEVFGKAAILFRDRIESNV